jgi:hypothetical protein
MTPDSLEGSFRFNIWAIIAFQTIDCQQKQTPMYIRQVHRARARGIMVIMMSLTGSCLFPVDYYCVLLCSLLLMLATENIFCHDTNLSRSLYLFWFAARRKEKKQRVQIPTDI